MCLMPPLYLRNTITMTPASRSLPRMCTLSLLRGEILRLPYVLPRCPVITWACLINSTSRLNLGQCGWKCHSSRFVISLGGPRIFSHVLMHSYANGNRPRLMPRWLHVQLRQSQLIMKRAAHPVMPYHQRSNSVVLQRLSLSLSSCLFWSSSFVNCIELRAARLESLESTTSCDRIAPCYLSIL